VGLRVVVDRWRAGQRRLGQVALACLAISLAASVLVYAWPTPKDRFEAQYAFEDAIAEYAERSVQAEEVAERVAALTAPGDYIYEFGRQSEIYFLADRQPATRWLHNRAYAMDQDVMDEILRDLEMTRPALILLTFECGPFATEFPGCEFGPPRELRVYLDEHYTHAGRVHYADLYLRRPPDRATRTATSREAVVMPGAASPEEGFSQ
jgi:hypothetical protein